MLARAKPDLAALSDVVANGREVGALMGAITEGLLGRLATGAPPIGFPGFDIDGAQEFNDSDGSDELFGLTIIDPGHGNIRRWLKGYDII